MAKIKSISYIKANAAEIIGNIAEDPEPYIITQNGEAKAVLLDYESYEQEQETLALMKILVISEQQYREGKHHSLEEVVDELRQWWPLEGIE